MKKSILVLIGLLIFQFALSQNVKLTKEEKKNYKSTQLLGPYLTKGVTSNEDKVRVLYKWVTENIAYDFSKLDSDKPFDAVVGDDILKSKEAICFGYCQLLKELLLSVQIKSEVVDGYIPVVYADSVKVPTVDTHSWIAVEIDGHWFLMDPTWDAGYIGPLRTNKKEKFKKKWSSFNKKWDTKLAKVSVNDKAKKDKVEASKKVAFEKLKEQENQAPDFKEDIGFVQNPKEQYFLIPKDSFLLTHLPANPLWQLKNKIVTPKEFSENITEGEIAFAFNEKQEDYFSKLSLDRLLIDADEAYQYNQRNYQVKALNYYNFLQIITDKKLKTSLPPKYSLIKNDSLLSLNDTLLKYSKIGAKHSKIEYSVEKKMYTELAKQDGKVFKELNKSIEKNSKQNEKTLLLSEKRNEKLLSEINSFQGKIEKLKPYNRPNVPSLESEYAKNCIDSIQLIINEFKDAKEQWEHLQNEKTLQSLIDSLGFTLYKIKGKNNALKQMDYLTLKYERECNDLITVCMNYLETIYNDTLPVEMLDKNISTIVRRFSDYNRKVQEEFKTSDVINKYEQTALTNYMFSQLKQMYLDLQSMNKEAINHNVWVGSYLKKFEKIWDECKSSMKEQEKMIEMRKEFVLDKLEKSNLRNKNLYIDVTEFAKKFGAQLK